MVTRLNRLFCLLLIVALQACSSAVSLRNISTKELMRAVQSNVITEGKFSIVSVQTLRMSGLTEQAEKNPVEVFGKLVADPKAPGSFARLFTAIELGQREAQKEESRNPDLALGWYIASGERAFNLLTAPDALQLLPFDMRYDHIRLFYLNSIMRSFALLQKKKDVQWADGYEVKLGAERFLLRFEGGSDRFQLSDFDELFPAATVEIEGLTNRHRRPGFGLAFVAFRKNNGKSTEERYYPKKGLTFPVTAAIQYDPAASAEVRAVTLALYDTNKVESVSVRERKLTVAADYTAPFALMISKSKLSASLGLANMLETEDFESTAGFSMVQPFDPNKIPIITVHGLLSSPLTWIDVHNDLMGDPEIRKHYQIWHYTYSTGVPILFSASLFRQKLDEMYNFFDPKNDLAALHNTVIIAHSMGGLLTHTAVSNSGDALWSEFFGKPKREIPLDDREKSELADALEFEHRPFVGRVVFIAVPHRGSTMSESSIGWIGRKLISLPKRVLTRVTGILARAGALMKPEVRATLGSDAPSGILGLSPANPSLKALAGIAVDKDIPFHSIIGDQGSGLGEEGTDGVVPYKSAHLEGAQSELIVPADHTAHSSPLAVMELDRILRLHLDCPRTRASMAAQQQVPKK